MLDCLRTLAIAAVLTAASGCAIIDGLSGGGDCDTPTGDCDEGDTCEFTQTLGVPPIDEADIDNCGRNKDFSLGLCDSSAVGDDIIFDFFVERDAMYTICSSATQGSDFFVSPSCDMPSSLQCLNVGGGCVDMFLMTGPHFIFWQGSTIGDCSALSLQIFEVGDPPPGEQGAACLDGVDNDDDGRVDCEDSECNSQLVCDGIGDCDGGSVEGSCSCVNDNGCDDLGPGFICHPNAIPGVCGSDCRFGNDWCGDFGLLCGADGRCFDPGMGGGEICLDGVDNDFDGLTDCEDFDCRGTSQCDPPMVLIDACNGVDDGVNPGFPGGQSLIDEAACRCVADEGCDEIDPDVIYLCHPMGPDGICAPDCTFINWCPGGGCNNATGLCQ